MGPISAIGGNGGTGSAIGLGGAGGEILISTPGNIALGGAVNAYGGLDGAGITRACCGLIEIVAGGAVTQAEALTTDSLVATGTDVKLDLGNAVKSLRGSASNGNFTFNNSGNLELEGVSASSLASISATGNITGSSSAAGLPPAGISTSGSPLGNAVQGGTGVTLNAGGAIGSTTAPLAVAAPALAASAAYGIAIDLNAFGPTPATVNTLQNTTTGDILLNANGGTTIASLVSNPGGNVTINSFGPLDVQQGIAAGSGIFLSTGGLFGNGTLPNDMTLNGPFTYNTATGAFEVTIGAFGTLHLVASGLGLTAPLFPNPLNITKFTFLASDPLADSILVAASNSATASVNRATDSPVMVDIADPKTKRGDDKKAAAICK